MVASIPTLAVSAIFCIWNAYRHCLWRHEHLLRKRITYMLWVMATGEPRD